MVRNTRKPHMVHATGANVVAFPGVRVRRRLSVEPNDHPPKGQFGKAAVPKPKAPLYSKRDNQDIVVAILVEGQDLEVLTEWERRFLKSLLRCKTYTPRQTSCFERIKPR